MYTSFLFFVLSIISLCSGLAPVFNVIEDDGGFEVTIVSQLLTIIRHSEQSPFIFVGKGETSFESVEGNVKVNNYVSSKEPLRRYDVTQLGDSYRLTLSDGQDVEVELQLSTTDTHDLAIEIVEFPDDYDRIWIRFPSDVDEHLYGAGEQFTYFDLKGHNFPIWTREQGIGRDRKSMVKFLADQLPGEYGGDYHTSYFPLPTFTSSKHYYCHVNSSRYMELDFTHDDFHEIMVLGDPDGVYVSAADSMQQVLERLTQFVGTQPPLPEWLRDGVILGVQGGTQTMLDVLATAEKHELPVTGLWIQDWAGKIVTSFGQRVFWNWEWNPDRYPGLDEEIVRLADEKNVRLLAYITPHLNVQGSLYKSVRDKPYFMTTEAGEAYLMNFGEFTCVTVDFTVPEAQEWYKGVIKKNLIEFGFGGWMADFSEYIPVDARFACGETGATMHSRFPAMWARVNREAVEESGKLGHVMFYMRAGSHGSQQYSVMTWAGDQSVDFSYTDGLATTIPAALSLGMSGVGLTHFDIGGYTTVVRHGNTENVVVQLNMVRTEELFMRGAEMAVFTPVMRTHEGNAPQLNFQIYQHSESMRLFAKFVQQFRLLQPYTDSLMQENARTGIPLQRALFLHYEHDPKTWSIAYQYMYGRDLLVAPVLQPLQTTWAVYLPTGDDWVHLYQNVTYKGGQSVTVLAPVGTPPVFYREGTDWKDLFQQVAAVMTPNQHQVKTEL